jgi:hypothetical protein
VGEKVFPPFHWVFLGRKREKERRKKEFVTVSLPPNPWTQFHFQSLKVVFIAEISQNLT